MLISWLYVNQKEVKMFTIHSHPSLGFGSVTAGGRDYWQERKEEKQCGFRPILTSMNRTPMKIRGRGKGLFSASQLFVGIFAFLEPLNQATKAIISHLILRHSHPNSALRLEGGPMGWGGPCPHGLGILESPSWDSRLIFFHWSLFLMDYCRIYIYIYIYLNDMHYLILKVSHKFCTWIF